MNSVNSKVLWAGAKFASVAFNSISTWNVFHEALIQKNSSVIAFLGTFTAIVLIDVLTLAFLSFLDDEQREENYTNRWAYAIGLIVLYLCIVLIGFKDEGILAFAPRVGLGILVFASVMRFSLDWLHWRDETWDIRYEKKKHRTERYDQYVFLTKQRRKKNKARKDALNKLFPELVAEYLEQHRNQLLTFTGHPTPRIIESSSVVKEHSSDDLIDLIIETEDGYGWIDPDTGEEHYETATGKPYSESGAKKALARKVNPS